MGCGYLYGFLHGSTQTQQEKGIATLQKHTQTLEKGARYLNLIPSVFHQVFVTVVVLDLRQRHCLPHNLVADEMLQTP